MGISLDSVHPALSRRIFSTCFAARSIARRTSPGFASSYTRATRGASSPAPRLRSFPSSDSMITRTNRPWSSWIVAISEVPTIAAVIAATIFGSTPSGRVCVTTRPSRRTTAADLMSDESDRESEQRGEIAEHGHVERSDIAILKRSEIGQGGSKQEDDEEHGEVRSHGRGRGGADLELADAHHDSEQAGERRQEPEQVEFVLPAEHGTDLSCRFDNRTVSDQHARFRPSHPNPEAFRGSGRFWLPRSSPSRASGISGIGRRPPKGPAGGRPNYITNYLRPVGAGAGTPPPAVDGVSLANIKIENVVASTSLGEELDLQAIARVLGGAEYEPEQFPGLIYRLKEPKTAILLFRSGKVVCTGAKSLENVKTAIDLVAKQIGAAGIPVHKNPEIVVQNIVATSDLGGQIDLNAIAISLGAGKVEYEPEQFPGLVYRIDEPKVVVLLFGSGKLVCTGARKPSDVEQAVERITGELKAAGLLR